MVDEQTYYSLITRYTAVAAAFMLVAIALAIAKGPRLLGAVVGVATIVAIVAGLAGTYSSSNAQPNLRAAFKRVTGEFQPGDQVVLVGVPGQRGDAAYYVARLRRRFPRAPVTLVAQNPPIFPSSGTRLWVVSDTGSQPAVAAALAKNGWRTDSVASFNPIVDVTLASR